MQKNTIKTAFHRGFTLIELMIVIVILGILMGTILPRLTGAQSRARDLARTSDLRSISDALRVYLDDNGQYPGTVGTAECLDPAGAATTTAGKLSAYLKGGKVPKAPSPTQVTGNGSGILATSGCPGMYVYIPLNGQSGIANSAFALVSDVENYQNANATLPVTGLTGAGASYTAVSSALAPLTAEATNAANSVYVQLEQ